MGNVSMGHHPNRTVGDSYSTLNTIYLLLSRTRFEKRGRDDKSKLRWQRNRKGYFCNFKNMMASITDWAKNDMKHI